MTLHSFLAPFALWITLFTLTSTSTSQSITDPASLVNLFIGTTNGGHVFPGATLPHGMVKVGMDTDSPENHAGYDAEPYYHATGFSQLHDSGTGGAVPLSLFKLWPFASCSSFEKCPTSIDSRKVLRKILKNGERSPDDFASPGYFSSNLSTSIRVELTATRRTALHRYTFPASSKTPRIAVDITNDGQMSSTDPIGYLDPNTSRVMGGASFAASFGPGRYRAYTCVDFKGDGYHLGKPTEYGVWLADYPVKESTNINQVYFGFVDQLGTLLTFAPNPDRNKPTSILARVGVSFISPEQACSNAESEIPDFNFEGTQASARAQWNELLGRVQVGTKGVDKEVVELFYSSLYRTHISPADYTGENPLWNSTEPYYDSLYCNWDTYRTLYPLMSLHDPVNFARIVRGMINIQKNEGWLPECRGATQQHYIQGGSNADPILGEFFVKFHDQVNALNVSATDLYNALLADAEKQPPNWNLQGRQANAWKKYNYIPQDLYDAGGASSKQVSRTLEHAFGDFAISQVAKLLGNDADSVKYAQRAGNFANVWNPTVTVPGGPGVLGMMQPRFINGTFGFTDPRHCSIHDPTMATCYLNAANRDGFYESSPIVVSISYVPQDTAKLIELQGGNEKFISRLDFVFDQNYFDSTDEPSQQIPFMYHYGNRPGLSTQRSRQVIAQYFNTSIRGLPGNDVIYFLPYVKSSGAMGSYAAFYLAGMYPLPATGQFLLSSPYFPRIAFFNPIFNKTTTIIANGFKGNPANGTGGSVFVKSVKIDGLPWKSNCYLDWDTFRNGSTVELELTDDIGVACGEAPDALPPSLSTGGF
ncbi:glycoside hydrolase family 92 protein [Piloderma croceum F 1598]|uniref:Glycoside hydrolase family 92 protein n=1 Tax=Piloderma croceum (strain F 1598) TaxID=765440 RepID=A0A0C3BH87_PILCF|nr:glycoside hydrolase family 92 protein [Piloderma croceum F 1598]